MLYPIIQDVLALILTACAGSGVSLQDVKDREKEYQAVKPQ
jgi:hypothetical protein